MIIHQEQNKVFKLVKALRLPIEANDLSGWIMAITSGLQPPRTGVGFHPVNSRNLTAQACDFLSWPMDQREP